MDTRELPRNTMPKPTGFTEEEVKVFRFALQELWMGSTIAAGDVTATTDTATTDSMSPLNTADRY